MRFPTATLFAKGGAELQKCFKFHNIRAIRQIRAIRVIRVIRANNK